MPSDIGDARSLIRTLLAASGLAVPEDQMEALAAVYAQQARNRAKLAAVDLGDIEPVVVLLPEGTGVGRR